VNNPLVRWLALAGVLAALLLLAVGICVGSTGFENLLKPLLNPDQDPGQTAMAQQIVWQIRLPRTAGRMGGRCAVGLGRCGSARLVPQPAGGPLSVGQRLGRFAGRGIGSGGLGRWRRHAGWRQRRQHDEWCGCSQRVFQQRVGAHRLDRCSFCGRSGRSAVDPVAQPWSGPHPAPVACGCGGGCGAGCHHPPGVALHPRFVAGHAGFHAGVYRLCRAGLRSA